VTDALNGLGEVLLGTGQPGQARTHHPAALGLASQIAQLTEAAIAGLEGHVSGELRSVTAGDHDPKEHP
jgi:hypothetical protein